MALGHSFRSGAKGDVVRLAAVVVVVGFGVSSVLQGTQAKAADGAAPRVAVISTQKVMQKAEAVQSIQEEMKRRRSAYQEKLTQKEKKIRQAKDKLRKKKNILSRSAYKERKKRIESKIKEIRNNIRKKKKEMKAVYSQAMKKVEQKIVDIVAKIANKRDIDVVVDKSAVVLVREKVEITNTVLQRLNKMKTDIRLPKAGNE